MNQNDWMKDPALAGIDQKKLVFLEQLFMQGNNLSQKEMMPFLLSLTKQCKENHISFEKNEVQLIFSVFQKYASPEELEKLKKLSGYMHA